MASFGKRTRADGRPTIKFYTGKQGESPWNQDLLWTNYVRLEKDIMFHKKKANLDGSWASKPEGLRDLADAGDVALCSARSGYSASVRSRPSGSIASRRPRSVASSRLSHVSSRASSRPRSSASSRASSRASAQIAALRAEIADATQSLQRSTAEQVTTLVRQIKDETERRAKTEKRLEALVKEAEQRFNWGPDHVRGFRDSNADAISRIPERRYRDSATANFGLSPGLSGGAGCY